MGTKLVAFRLKNDSTYGERYASLVEAIHKLTSTRWDEGTALYIFHHTASVSAIHAKLMADSKIYYDEDMLLVLDLEPRDYAQSGVTNLAMLDFVLKIGVGQNALHAHRSAVVNALLAKG